MNAAITYHRLDAETAPLLATASVFDNPVDPQQLARFQASEGHELVFAFSDGKVIGFASGTVIFHPDKPPAFFINEVGVEEAFRRRGIGTELCRRLIHIAQDHGCRGFWLATEDDNTAARALYQGLNARETSGIVVYDRDGAMDT